MRPIFGSCPTSLRNKFKRAQLQKPFARSTPYLYYLLEKINEDNSVVKESEMKEHQSSLADGRPRVRQEEGEWVYFRL